MRRRGTFNTSIMLIDGLLGFAIQQCLKAVAVTAREDEATGRSTGSHIRGGSYWRRRGLFLDSSPRQVDMLLARLQWLTYVCHALEPARRHPPALERGAGSCDGTKTSIKTQRLVQSPESD